MQQRNYILKKLKNYNDNELNPSKKNFLDSTKEDYEELKSIVEIRTSLGISKHDYEEALSIPDDNDFHTHYKMPPNSCFGKQIWIFNQFSTITKQLHTYVLICQNLKMSVQLQ